jgi:hypothetical protein
VSDQVNFADYHYVGSHNAHVYQRFFKTVFQHTYDIKEQLASGIRGFMLDVYPWDDAALNPLRYFGIRVNRKFGTGDSVLSHGQPGFIAFTQKGLTGCCITEYQTYKYELHTIIDFLKQNPTEIVVVLFEQHVPINALVKETYQVMHEADYDVVLRPADWDVYSHGLEQHVWPTIGWMRDYNKRLILFHGLPRRANSDLTWSMWRYNTENVYGVLYDAQQLAKERGESVDDGKTEVGTDRVLSIFNHFTGLAVTRIVEDVQRDHTYTRVNNLYGKCSDLGFAHGRVPNGYFGDRIIESVEYLRKNNEKTVFDLVNELNIKG